MSSIGTYYTYETDAQGDFVLDANGNKIIETTWTITDAGLGASNVTIADSSGNTIETLSGVPDSLLRGYHIQTGVDAVNGSLVSIIGGDWVSVPGSTGTIDIVLSALSVPVFTIGGTTDINFLVNAATAITVDIYGGTASFSGGLVAGALSGSTINIGYGGTYNGNTQLVSLLQGTTVNFTTGGGTLVLNGGGVFLNLSGTTINGYDPSKDTIEIQDTVAPVSGYIISGSGDTRTITLIGSDGTPLAEYSVAVASGANVPVGTYNNSVNSADLATNPLKITYANGNTYIGACFLSGSMIRTPEGEVAVEDVRIGDVLSVFDWRNNAEIKRAVTWVGNQRVVVREGLPDDEAGYPVRVLKDAITDGVPYKDMLITSEHCLFFEDSFVPVRMLVNGRSIFYDKTITNYTYYHIETESHSVIWADGALTESYLDTGNRGSFRQHGNLTIFDGGKEKSWENDGGAPLSVSRSYVEALFQTIEQRAEVAQLEWKEMPPIVTEDADLHLVTETGTTISQVREYEGYVMFMIPASVGKVRIVSKVSRPSDAIGPFVDDRRYLGVAVGEITLFQSGRNVPVTTHLTDAGLEGWHALEGEEMRWTAGNAVLSLGNRPSSGVAMLAMRIMAAGPYLMASQGREFLRVSA